MKRVIEAGLDDIGPLALLREPDAAAGPADPRMFPYLEGIHHPHQALPPRVIYMAVDGGAPVGYIGGHLTRRLGCEGELQYLYVVPKKRRDGIASMMLDRLWEWFRKQGAARICVDAGNEVARAFYKSRGAEALGPHWLFWPDIGPAPRRQR